LLLASCAGLSGAQPTPIDPADLDGRTFAGVPAETEPAVGEISFRASRVWVWTETPPRAPSGEIVGLASRRLLLDGNVEVTLGGMSFIAERACVWLEKRPGEGDPAYRFFIYFDRAGTPGSEAESGVWADRLPVRGNLIPSRGVRLSYDVLREGRPPAGEIEGVFVREGERALALFLRSLVAPSAYIPEGERGEGEVYVTPRAGERPLIEGRQAGAEAMEEILSSLPASGVSGRIFADTGLFSFYPGDAPQYRRSEDGGAVAILTGGIMIQYWQRATASDPERTLQLRAENAVIFFAPGGDSGGSLTPASPGEVEGIYLEGHVEAEAVSARRGVMNGRNDIKYTIRSPRVYYDIARNRALMLDAVFWTYDERRQLPLYLRAGAIRQASRDEFSAERARLTNTGFFEPDLALGVGEVTISRYERADGSGGTHIDASDVTLRAGGLPFAYFPGYAGDPTRIPLRDVRLENRNGNGTAIKTAWDLLSALGIDGPAGLGVDALIEYYFDRGIALGLDAGWGQGDDTGRFLAYGLPDDTGTDNTSSGGEIDRDGEARSIVLGEHRQNLGEGWRLKAEGAYISDPAFVDTFFPEISQRGREVTSALNVSRTDGIDAFSVEAKASLIDFTPNEYLLQSQGGYTVDRLPEGRFARVGGDVLGETAPGLVSYSSESRLGLMRFRFSEPNADEFGFTGRRAALDALGVLPNESPSDLLRAQGLTESPVTRFDTRHEMSAQLEAGEVEITPFAVGRLTAYDDSFEGFSQEDDQARLWGGGGVRFATTVQRVDNSVESKVFDLHRMRHIVEPSATVWYADTTLERADLPVYDETVENISDGTAVRLGVDQTWQTKRGGPGRWRSVDVFTLDAELVLASDDTDRKSSIGQWFEDRPEESNLGDFSSVAGAWRVTEATALVGRTVYSFDYNQPAATSAGVAIQHTPDFSTLSEVRYINAEDATFLSFSASYQLTKKYGFRGRAVYDTDEDTLQWIGGSFERSFPAATLGFGIGYNDITSETSFSFNIRPRGLDSRGARLQNLGVSEPRSRSTGVGG
jgi:hypothetical protein